MQFQSTNVSISLELTTHQVWIENTVAMVNERGYRTTPVYLDGKTMPYADGQSYPYASDPCWRNAIAVGVVLDNAILVDSDGNKAAETGDDLISLADLAAHFGLPQMPLPVQENTARNSLHFLFRLPTGENTDDFKQSCDGYLPYIDLKRGNQLMHLKPHKIITNGALPLVSDLPEAPPTLVEAFLRGNSSSLANRREAPSWSGARREVDEAHAILRYIEPAEDYEPWLDVLMRIHDKFGATEEAIEIADVWSSRADNYAGIDEVSYKLASFEAGVRDFPHKKSWGALCIRARENGADLGAIREIFGASSGDSA